MQREKIIRQHINRYVFFKLKRFCDDFLVIFKFYRSARRAHGRNCQICEHGRALPRGVSVKFFSRA